MATKSRNTMMTPIIIGTELAGSSDAVKDLTAIVLIYCYLRYLEELEKKNGR